jgi:hypothetical protein
MRDLLAEQHSIIFYICKNAVVCLLDELAQLVEIYAGQLSAPLRDFASDEECNICHIISAAYQAYS